MQEHPRRAVAALSLRPGQGSVVDGTNELAADAPRREAQAITEIGIEPRGPATGVREGDGRPGRVLATEEPDGVAVHDAASQRDLEQEDVVAVGVCAEPPSRPRHIVTDQTEGAEALMAQGEHISQALRGVSRVHPAHLLPPGLHHIAFGVDVGASGVREHDARVGVEHGQGLVEELRSVLVVGRRPLDVAGRRVGQVQDVGEVPRRAAVALLARVADPRVDRREAPGDLLGSVRGGVVADDQLEVAHLLRQQRLDGTGEELLAVVDGQPDAHERRGHESSSMVTERNLMRWPSFSSTGSGGTPTALW